MRCLLALTLALTLPACSPRTGASSSSSVVSTTPRFAPASADPPAAPTALAPQAGALSTAIAPETSAPPSAIALEPAATPAKSLPAFEIEAPYAPGTRARPAGSVVASVEDEHIARWNVGGNGDPEHLSRRPGFHPAVRVTVDVRPLARLPRGKRGLRVLTETRLLAQARSKGYWPIRHCYETALRRSPREEGETRARISIAPSGRVTAARLLGSELSDREARACLVQALRGLRFDPAPSRRLDVDVSLELWPGDAPLPPLSPTLPGAAFDLNGLRARITEHTAELSRCYVAGLDRDPALWGRVALRVEVAADGSVSSALEDESRFPDPEVVSCLTMSLRAIALPANSGPYAFVLAVRCGLPPEPAAPPTPVAGEP